MTDEEMAEGYAFEKWPDYPEKQEIAEQAFLAGLEIDRLKWHKVADGNLPKVNSTVLDENGDKVVYIGGGEWEAYSEYYEKYVGVSQPFAWCEVPRYTEV